MQYSLLSKQLHSQKFIVECVVGQVQGFWLLEYHQYCTLTETLFILPLTKSWRYCCCGSPGLILTYTPSDHRSSRCWGEPTQNLGCVPVCVAKLFSLGQWDHLFWWGVEPELPHLLVGDRVNFPSPGASSSTRARPTLSCWGHWGPLFQGRLRAGSALHLQEGYCPQASEGASSTWLSYFYTWLKHSSTHGLHGALW